MTTTTTINNPTLRSAKEIKLFSYVGSKLKYKKHYDSLLAKLEKKEYKVYVEAFAGSLASLFHNLQHIKADKIVINDFNPKIINLYQQVKTNPEEVFEKYQILENEFNRIVPKFIKDKYKSKTVKLEDRMHMTEAKRFFIEAREVYDNLELDTNHAALFVFIMKHCFSGNYTENKQGKLSTGFNWNSKEIDVENVKSAIMKLHEFFNSNDVVFENIDVFKLVNKYDNTDTFIYLDPPYSDSTIQYGTGKRSRKKAVNNITFNEIKLHQQLIEACSKYECVMYSNNFDEIFIDNFDNHTTFERNNSIGKEEIKKIKLEILAIKTNVIVQVIEKARPITELLGLSSSLETHLMSFTSSHTPIVELMGISNNNNYENENNQENIA